MPLPTMHKSSSSSLNSTGGALSSSRIGQRRKNVKKGHQFTLMVVGASGLGRSTFVNTLCSQTVLSRKDFSDPQNAAVEDTMSIQPTSVELEEEGLKLSLTVIDTPGFGDAVDNEGSFKEILHYIEKQYDDLVAEESRIKRNPKNFDNRVHALLYFIAPTGHALRELDIELMKRLAPRVNIIPVIGKADSLTTLEMATFKKRIMEDIAHYAIPIYDFPFDVDEDDEETVEENMQLRALLPFSLIGSEGEYSVSGRKVRGRKYPWGVVEVDNPKHCDFVHLRDILLSTHLNELKDLTHDVLYENYRTEKLSRAGELTGDDLDDAQRIREEQLRREEEKLREKELAISREMLEKRQELLAKEAALRSLEMKLAQSQDNLA